MTAPAYSNAGTLFSSSNANSLTPTLPASLVAGNVLLAICGSKNAETHSCSGWTQWPTGVQFQYSTTLHVSIWYYEVDGAETAPAISWTNNSACIARVVQYTRAPRIVGSTIGSTYSNNSGNGATHSTSSFNTAANNSTAVYIDVASANTALATPSGWTERIDSGGAGAAMQITLGDKSVPTASTATGAISVTGANADWVQIQLELLEPGTPTYTLTAGAGDFTLAGGNAGLVLGYNMVAGGGDFTLTGGNAELQLKRFPFGGPSRPFSSFHRYRSG